MNILLPRFFRAAYRNDPIPSFLITVGAADTALGGSNGHAGLALLGLMIVGVALGLKWSQSQRKSDAFSEQLVQNYLPSSSQSEMPMLSISKKRLPN